MMSNNLLRIIGLLLLFTTLLPLSVFSFEKKSTWEETLQANPAGGERVVDGWHTVGPFSRSSPILWNNQLPPEKKIKTETGYIHNGKTYRWEKQSLDGGRIVVYKNTRNECFGYADFTWDRPERVIFRIHTRGARYININGQQVWEWDYISDRENYVFSADLKRKNRIFLQISSFRSWLRMTCCSERIVRGRTELLLYLCEQFGSEYKRIVGAADKIIYYLDSYGRDLSAEYRRRVYGRIKTVLEKCLQRDVSAERISYYLDFCMKTEEQPFSSDRLAKLISQCPAKDRPGILFRLGGLYITSFGSPGRGMDLFRELMSRPETRLSLADDVNRFCNNYCYYLEGAEMLSGIEAGVKPDQRLDMLSKLSGMYRKAGERRKALEYYEKIIEAGTDGRNHEAIIKRSRAYRTSLVREINKESICILPRAIGLVNGLEYIGKLASNGQLGKAYTELKKEIDKFPFSVVDSGREVSLGTISCISQRMRTWPESFTAYIDKQMTDKAASLLEQIDVRDRRAIRHVWHKFRIAPGTARLFISYASRLLRQGDARSAACWYERILKRHADPCLYLPYAYALCLSGDFRGAEELRNRLDAGVRTARVQFRGKQTEVMNGLAALLEEFGKKREEVPAGVPSVKGWYDRVSPADRILCRADRAYSGYVEPPCVPVRKDNMLYLYTGSVLRAYDIRTGTLQWSARVRRGGRVHEETPVPVLRMQVCGDRIYVRVPGRAYSLNAYNRFSGDKVWSSSVEPGLQGLHIASAPALANGMIVCTVARYHTWKRKVSTNTELFAAAVRPDTGQVLWKHLLVSGDSMYGNEDLSTHLPQAAETDHGIFIQTNRKVFLMLDPLSGAVEWAVRYKRSAGHGSKYTLYVNRVAVYGDSCIAAPRDSSYVYCLDISSGRVRWITSKGVDPVVCGIYRGNAILLGRNLRMIDIGSGKEVKSMRVCRQDRFPLPFISGKRLWVSYPSSGALFNLATMDKVMTGSFPERGRLYPVRGYAVAEDRDRITVYGYSGKDFHPAAARYAQESRFVPAGENGMVLGSVVKGKRKIPGSGEHHQHPSGTVKPVLWWMKPMDMNGYGGVRGGTELIVWNRNCVRLIETNLFGETLWEHSFDPSGFSVRHVQNIGNSVFVLGSRKISCLDISSGTEKWRITMPMHVRSLHWNGGKAYLYSQRILPKDHVWRVDLLDIESGSITRFAAGGSSPIVWDNDCMMVFKGYEVFHAIDVSTGKTMWKKKMNHHRFTDACLFQDKSGTDSFLFLNFMKVGRRGKDTLMDPDTGTVIFQNEHWELLPRIWQTYGEPYAYYNNKVMRFIWNSTKKKLKKKWHRTINNFGDRWMASYGIIGSNLAVFSHAGNNYIELTQLDRKTGKIQKRGRLMHISEGYRGLESPQWRGSRIYALSDRTLYCFIFPGNKEVFAGLNERRKKMLESPYSRLDRIRSIRMYEVFLRGLRPSWDLSKNKIVLNTQKQWFPSNGKDNSLWKGEKDASLSVAGIAGDVLRLQIHVTDDTWIPFTGHYSGDRLIITTGKNTAYVGMNTRLEPVVRGISSRYIGRMYCQVMDSSTIRYTIELKMHLHYFAEYHYSRKSKVFHLSVGISFADDDGRGVEGSLSFPQPHEWGILRCGRE